jgi:glycine dehydrogenase
MTRDGLQDTREDRFVTRHLGPRPDDIDAMLELLGYRSLDELVDAVVPTDIRLRTPLGVPPALSERAALNALRGVARKNQVFRSYLGMGFADCIVPPVIQRNVLENPGWYTAYTPYQAEISQGRLEALLTFQTMIADLTGLPIANASLLDEATAAAEAMAFSVAVGSLPDAATPVFLVDEACHPQTIAVVRTRADYRGIRVIVGDPAEFTFEPGVVGALVQYPSTEGCVADYRGLTERAHAAGVVVTAAVDLLSLALLTPPGAWGADVAIGNSQRFGVPMGYGGPHAAFFATTDEYKRFVPGRIIGVTVDRKGRPALRMALQTREQHIRREKATSNICTAQVLLAVMAAMYAVYHGPDGIRRIAERVHRLATLLAAGARRTGLTVVHDAFFDTVVIETDARRAKAIHAAARDRRVNLRALAATRIGITLDEPTTADEVKTLIEILAAGKPADPDLDTLAATAASAIPAALRRTGAYLTHPVFHRYRSETEMLRYLKTLEQRDFSLATGMISLGSCTMKLNPTSAMVPVSWPEFAGLHPFAPPEQAEGYTQLFRELEADLAAITGFARISLQPNAGSQGEYTGLLTIRAYQRANDQGARDVCLIPTSAHGTNPASAVMAGLRVVTVKTDAQGNVELDDLKTKAAEHKDHLAALMITYPSTHGVFEGTIREICKIVHANGGQVYLDGANMNALVGVARPGDIGADVCHLNLHKTFAIPHGGGGPGMGPIGVAAHLADFLPDHPVIPLGRARPCGTVAAAPWGSASILPISWAYIRLLGPDGLAEATKVAILNANYVARRLRGHFDVLYAGRNGLVAHECIIDTRPVKASAGIEAGDIATRLMDYGFHAPTVSFPVAGTMMVEPTESESKEELDRFCDALIAIRDEIREIERGEADRNDNVVRNAPHPLADLLADEWNHRYSRERAAFPTRHVRERKVWPPVGRADGAYGDRHLVCVCPPMTAYEPIGTT